MGDQMENDMDYTNYLYQEIQDEISEFHFHSFQQAAKHYQNQAEAGDEQAMYIYAVQLEGGYGVQQDYKEAIKWYQEAAKLGNSRAKYNLGLIYYVGRYEGIEGTKQQALEYFIEAANDEFDKACLQLGHLYLLGSNDIEQDIMESIKYYEKAAELENFEAYNCLGNIYKTGKVVDGVVVIEQDIKKAKEYYQKGADGSALAKYNLGCIYYEGLQESSDQQDLEDQHNEQQNQKLNQCQNQDNNQFQVQSQIQEQDQDQKQEYQIQPNHYKAFKLFKEAADLRVRQAAFNLGAMLETGTGCRKNLKKSLEYYKLSKELGYQEADEHFQRVKQQLREQKKKGGCSICVVF
ncbi:hypothetical protein PPERSA_11097 [Pseudocohnilembus persalinus]|uniref:Uncharacterized protein n=1 Tax=Pseudocohnilembus persalinus TaxID=266149 RepID=A0A0V0QZ02_PSEPJ|nr:hypothetical protein PPERSA_11097 [Pseudocohnilembus persalinus]|eukprot:KRX07548.1 hypothetical protein PPERSA_11097 [Pseudocohnilembus persalinus]